MTPGPTPVPSEVLAATARPIVHHRSPDFRPIYERCLARLKEVFRTSNDVLLFTSFGSGALESAIAYLFSPGERVVVVSAGYFGERWSGFAAVAKEAGELVAVDAISSLGAIPLETDAWALDAVVSGSQKALMTPPGLAMVSVSEAAWEARAKARCPRFYFDWERTRDAQAKLDAAFTPAVSLVVGLDVALGLVLERGLEAAFEHHVRLGRACREGVKAMGLELFSPDDDSSEVVTTVRVPEAVDGAQLLLDLRDRFGITLAPGQGELKGKVFRIGHIGYFDVFDITTALAGIEVSLAEAGADVERGVAVTRALETYERTPA